MKSEKTKDTTKAETEIYKRGVRRLARIIVPPLDVCSKHVCGTYQEGGNHDLSLFALFMLGDAIHEP